MIDNLINSTESNLNIILFFLLAFVVSFIITPLVARIATQLGAVDLPANLRLRNDKSKNQRLHKITKPRLGGIAIMTSVIFAIFLSTEKTPETIGILVGLGIIFIFGFLDDKYELSSKVQLLGQVLAAIAAIIGGISIQNINIGGLSVDLTSYSQELINFGEYVYTLNLPADLITLIWIVGLINAINWMCGIDALGEIITLITASAIGFISIHYGNVEFALIAFILAGGILGFIPYNFPPSKILGGSVSDLSFGFLLSTLAILSSAKLTTSLLILIIPILDMIYVIFRRVIEHKVVNPVRLMGISGRIHFHHRIIDLGYSQKATLYLEAISFFIIANVGLLFENVLFEYRYLYIISISFGLIFMAIIIVNQINSNRRKARKRIKRAKIVEDLPPEEKYKY